jgi:hypothetical protein
MQRGIKRTVLHLQELICCSLNVFANLMPMRRPIKKCPQDEHVERALEEPDPLLYLFRHRRRSTLDMAMMVDIRLLVVKG